MKLRYAFFVFILAGLLLLVPAILPLVSAEDIITLGTFKQGTSIDLIQTCDNETDACDSCNITSIKYPDSTVVVEDVSMTKDNTEFNYTLNSSYSTELGFYIVNGFCEADGEIIVWVYNFEITLNGKEKPAGTVIVAFSIIFLIIVALLISLLLYNIGKFAENEYTMWDIIYNYSAYFVLFATYILSQEYLANAFVNNFMLWVISICGFTNIFFPAILLMLSLTVWKWREQAKW